MKTGGLVYLMGRLRRLAEVRPAGDLSDRELLERFVTAHEEAAFALLVQRHGAMVLGVGQQLLGDVHEAEDVFQATFLVLARRGRAIRKRDALASWLYGVARRIAAKVRAQAHRREHLPKPTNTIVMTQTNPLDHATRQELRSVLDEELARLLAKCRAPMVLCYLEGKTQEQAAAELGCPKTTLSSRLGRGRELLRERLSRRGITLSAGVLAGTIAENTSQAAVPAALLLDTVRTAKLYLTGAALAGAMSPSAVALAEGAGKAMAAAKWKTALAYLLLLGGVFSGVAVLVGPNDVPQATAPPQHGAPPNDPARPQAAPAPVRKDRYGDPLPPGAVARLAADAKRVAALVADLDSPRFAVREKAVSELQHLGADAAPALGRALQKNPSLETRRRVEQLLKKLENDPHRLRSIRAVEVLEHIASPPAQEFLRELRGDLEACLTREAKTALQRLAQSALGGGQ